MDEDQAEMYEYRGQTYTGVRRPASEVLLRKGALCRAQEEIYESNEVKQEIKNSTGGTSPLYLESDPVPKKQRTDTQEKNGRERQRIDP